MHLFVTRAYFHPERTPCCFHTTPTYRWKDGGDELVDVRLSIARFMSIDALYTSGAFFPQ